MPTLAYCALRLVRARRKGPRSRDVDDAGGCLPESRPIGRLVPVPVHLGVAGAPRHEDTTTRARSGLGCWPLACRTPHAAGRPTSVVRIVLAPGWNQTSATADRETSWAACHGRFRVTLAAQWLVSALIRLAEVLGLENTDSRTDRLGDLHRCSVGGGSRRGPDAGLAPSSRSVSHRASRLKPTQETR